jgi:general secretion pathway protein A
MPIETLENLRMLSNLETSKEKLLQIILVGQPELEAVLERAELRQLKQRIAVRSVLSPLSPKESCDYIQHRLTKCGGDIDSIFSKSALKLINRHAAGIPRKINIICDNVLINGYGYMQKPVSAKVVREVLADLEGKSRRFPLKWVFLGLAVLVSLAAIVWFSLYGSTFLSSIVNVGPMKSRSTPSPGDKRPPPAPLHEEAHPKDSAASPLGIKIRKEVPGAEERPAEPTPSPQSPTREPPKSEPPPAGALQQTSEPAKVLETPKPAVSSSQTAPSEKENKKAADSPKTDPVPVPREVQKADERKDRASGSPPDPSEIVDWLLKKRSTSDR